jgi:hypothetical protein
MSTILPIDAIFYGVLGMILGILLSGVYYKNMNEKNVISKIIDTAMIENKVFELEALSIDLIQLVSKIVDSSEELNSQVVNTRDIELNLKSLDDLEKIKYIDIPSKVDVLETNE